jgi:hypothetical protein
MYIFNYVFVIPIPPTFIGTDFTQGIVQILFVITEFTAAVIPNRKRREMLKSPEWEKTSL